MLLWKGVLCLLSWAYFGPFGYVRVRLCCRGLKIWQIQWWSLNSTIDRFCPVQSGLNSLLGTPSLSNLIQRSGVLPWFTVEVTGGAVFGWGLMELCCVVNIKFHSVVRTDDGTGVLWLLEYNILKHMPPWNELGSQNMWEALFGFHHLFNLKESCFKEFTSKLKNISRE